MKIWIENYHSARDFWPQKPTAAIRIFDPGARNHRIKTDDPRDEWDNCPQAPFDRKAYINVLEYTFMDVNLDLYSEEQRVSWLKNPLMPIFDNNIARHILLNFKSLIPEAKWVLCHCNAGISRSVAVAHALNEIFDLQGEFQGRAKRFSSDYRGNSYVYRILCEEADKLEL